jgi:hypothetical protein
MGLVVISRIASQLDCLTSSNVFDPNIEVPFPASVRGIGHQLSIRRDCAIGR